MSSELRLGELVDLLFRLREKKKEVNNVLKQIGRKMNEVEAQIIQACDDQKSEGTRGRQATANLKRSVVPVAKDWNLINQFILRHKELALLQKRLSPVRYRELIKERPRGVPGMDSYENVTINLSELKK